MGERRIKNSAGKIVAVAIGAIFAVFLIGSAVFAQTLNTGLQYAAATGLANTDIRMIIAKIIRVALGLLGTVALVFTIYGGWMYMTAGGNEEKVTTAKKILLNMAIGLAIILSALGIVQFIINAITSQYEAQYGEEVPSAISEEYTVGGFLGQVIESHYPKRNAPWPGEPPIARNTKISVTFRDKIDASTLINNTNNSGAFGDVVSNVADQINATNLKIYATADKEITSLGMNASTADDDVYAGLSDDGRTIVLRPKNSFVLSSGKDTNYTVDLKGGVKLANGALAFSGMGGHYSWQFTVSNKDDKEPPQVQSIIPLPATSAYPKNIIVQINFNEAVDPISASGFFQSGTSKNFQNVTITSSTGQKVNGEYRISNQYRTIEFVSDTQCGVNPCGQPIFCLPANDLLTITAKSATIDPANAPQILPTNFRPDGVVDMAGNALNGGGELKLIGSQITLVPGIKTKTQWETDKTLANFFWKFNTSANLDTHAPFVINIQPNINAEGISSDAPITVTFNKSMLISTFNQIILKTNKYFNVWYTPAAHNFKSDETLAGLTDVIHHSQAELLHGPFWKRPANSTEVNASYFTFFDSRVSDIYQNCFYKAVGPGCTAAQLNDPNRSCYNGAVSASTSTCKTGEICPPQFNPAPRP